LGVDAHPCVERRRRGENLENRSGAVADRRERLRLDRLPCAEIEPVGAVVAHRKDAVGVPARFDNAHDARDAVEGRARDLVDGLLDGVLHLRVQRGANQVSVARQVFFVDAGTSEIGQRVVAEERAVAGTDAALR